MLYFTAYTKMSEKLIRDFYISPKTEKLWRNYKRNYQPLIKILVFRFDPRIQPTKAKRCARKSSGIRTFYCPVMVGVEPCTASPREPKEIEGGSVETPAWEFTRDKEEIAEWPKHLNNLRLPSGRQQTFVVSFNRAWLHASRLEHRHTARGRCVSSPKLNWGWAPSVLQWHFPALLLTFLDFWVCILTVQSQMLRKSSSDN